MLNGVMHAVTSVETNVNWNGARNTYFRPQRGIRQGDLISLYLFVLCMDKLSHLIDEEVRDKKWKAIRVGKGGTFISHLMFVDDLLMFGEAIEKQIRCVMNTLKTFCRMSVQEVSQDKTSILFSKNVSRSIHIKLTHMSNYRVTNSFDKYLGVPLKGSKLKKADFQYIMEQIARKLAKWKRNNLSFAGRSTIIKSVMESIPIYPIMTNRMLKA